MSVRNKKLISLNHTLEHSLEKVKQARPHKSQEKKQIIHNPFLAKVTHNNQTKVTHNYNSLPKKFQVRKISQQPTQQDLTQTKSKFRSLRMHTEKLVNTPYTVKYNKSPYERSHTIEMKESQKEEKYPFLTNFEKQEIFRYQIHFIGKRRIHSLKDFTSKDCQARIATGDSVAYRYEVVSGLGHGSFGQVFKAFDHKKKQMVALKIIRNQPKFNRQAKVQIRILQAALMHDPKFKSNIVQLKHAFFFRGHACLVFQLLHINLYQFLKLYKFSGLNLDLIRRITIQVLQGLVFFKKHKIIHCDLKPQNILLKQQHKTGIKIIDAGSGCFEGEQIYTYIQSRYYRAPQVIMGITYTNAIDIWSLGCILCQLFLGYPIFPGQNQPQQMLMFMEVLGVPPPEFIEQGSRSHKFFQGNLPRVKANSKGKLRKPGSKSLELVLNECGDLQFVRFIQKFLQWLPQDRIDPQQALFDPWIVKGLPQQIKKQHYANAKRQKSLI